MTPLTRMSWLAFALVAVGLAAFYVVAAAHLFPVMGIDSSAHIVPILNYKAGHGFGGVVLPLTRDYDPTGQHRFLQYPPLFHLTVAALIRHADFGNIYACLAGCALAGLGLYAGLILLPTVGGAGRSRPLWVALAGLSLVAVSTWLYQLPSSGRAEALATPLLILGTILVLRSPARWQPVVAGVFIGLIGATQIAVACLAGIFYSAYVSTRPADAAAPVRRWLVSVVVAGVVSLGAFAACLLFSPFSMAETVRGIAFHMSTLPADNLYSPLTYYIFPAYTATFYGLFFGVLLVHYLWWHGRRLHWLGAANLALFVLGSWSLGIRHPNRCYNLLPFAPIFAALALNLVARLEAAPDEDSTHRPPTWQRGSIYAVYFGAFALMSVGMLRQAVVYELYRQRGVSYTEAKHAFETLLPPGDHTPVIFNAAVCPLLTEYDHAYQLFDADFVASQGAVDPVPDPFKPDLLVHQWTAKLVSPPEIRGYRLVWNDFVQQPPPRFFGVKVAGAIPGYSFAFYQPVSP